MRANFLKGRGCDFADELRVGICVWVGGVDAVDSGGVNDARRFQNRREKRELRIGGNDCHFARLVERDIAVNQRHEIVFERGENILRVEVNQFTVARTRGRGGLE